MCKIMGISLTNEVERHMSQYYLRHFFAEFGRDNPHGWGFCFYDKDGQLILFKEPVPALSSPSLRFLLDTKAMQSNCILAHVRLKSVGPIAHHLTQPFTDGHHAFAHNGTISGFTLKINTATESDSLYLFRSLERIWHSPKLVVNHLKEVNHLGSVTVILTNGRSMLAYRDKDGLRPLFYKRINSGYLVCSLTIGTERKWKPIAPGYALLFENGSITNIFN